MDEGITDMLMPLSELSVTRIAYTDDNTLYDLVNFEHPYAIFINEFEALDTERIISLIFSVPSAFVRYIIVIHVGNNKLDVYDGSTTHTPEMMYQRRSIVVNTKEEFINLALRVSCYA